MNLIPRLFDPTEGEILIDGIELSRIPIEVLRRLVAVVPQEAFVFSTSVRENIAFGLDEAAEPTVAKAIELAALDKDVSLLPKGVETEVGERGVRLSGGQRQRLALARALAVEARILILDNPFSNVDAQTESDILDRLRPTLSGRTCLVVSNRPLATRLASLIIVLERGRVVETGTHRELMAAKGLYERLHRMQLLEESLDQF